MVAAEFLQMQISGYEKDSEIQKQNAIKDDENLSVALSTREKIRQIFDPNYRETTSILRPLPDPFFDQFAARSSRGDIDRLGNSINRATPFYQIPRLRV